MHLLRCDYTSEDLQEIEIALCEWDYASKVPYAILSHRWARAEDEVTYHDLVQKGDSAWQLKKGYKKIIASCKQALRDGLSYIWIDTCCINKDSSAELSEAINSMYKWYMDSIICYAYLEDVRSDEDLTKPGSTFRSSQWFTRGWTLQEMIAPIEIRFFTGDWVEIAKKSGISKYLHEITRVPEAVLLNPKQTIPGICVSQKMYWASGRRTTRVEDRAYSLLGIFNINMPTLYGEGEMAFRRLQEEILRTRFDHTIFAWQLIGSCSGLLASSPDAFTLSDKVRKMPIRYYHRYFSFQTNSLDYSLKNLGLEILLPYAESRKHRRVYTAYIACHIEGNPNPLYLLLRRHREGLDNHFFRTRTSSESLGLATGHGHYNSQTQDRLSIMEPEEVWRRAVRPLPSDNLLDQDCNDVENVAVNAISLYVPEFGEVQKPQEIAAYPMSLAMQAPKKRAGISFETVSENGVVWVFSLLLRPRLEVKVLLVVIDNDLLCHIEANGSYEYDPFETEKHIKSCMDFYERNKLSSEPPRTAVYVNCAEDRGNKAILVKAFYRTLFDSEYAQKYVDVHLCASEEEKQPKTYESLEEREEPGKELKRYGMHWVWFGDKAVHIRSMKSSLSKCKHISAHLYESIDYSKDWIGSSNIHDLRNRPLD